MAGVVTLAALLVWSLTGCGAVHVSDPSVSASQRRACEALVQDLPHRVAGLARRDTSGGDLGAAWGDPPIVLRCGVGTPEGYRPTSPCMRANGVDWFAPEDQVSDQGKDAVLTTIGRRPDVEVRVPAEHRPPDAVEVDLAQAIKEHSEVVSPCS